MTTSKDVSHDDEVAKLLFDEQGAKVYQVVLEQHTGPLGPCEAMDRKLNEYMGSESKATILDLATGPGEPGILMAKRRPHMTFLLTDVSTEMVDKAKSRSEGLTNTRCFQMNAEDMAEIQDDSMDAIVCCYGLMFPQDKAKAFSEINRTLKPGGILIAAYWKQVPVIKYHTKVMEAVLGRTPPPPPSNDNPLRLAGDGIMEKLLSDANLKLLEMEENEYPFDLGTDRDFAFAFCSLPIDSFVKEQEASGNKEAFSIANKLFDPWMEDNNFLDSDGTYRIHGNVYKLAVAKKE